MRQFENFRKSHWHNIHSSKHHCNMVEKTQETFHPAAITELK